MSTHTPTSSELYSSAYYDAIVEGSRRSAGVVVPIITSIMRARAVVDVGCGTGAWLAEFARNGASRILGLDGDHVDRSRLLIPADRFTPTDLESGPRISERFDLAVCLEVAEHVHPDASETLIDALTTLAPVVLFSAAIPYQGGEGHINERWPTFWYDLFVARGYALVDPIRKRIWSDRRVEPWYQQNMVMYASPEALALHPALRREQEQTFPGFLSVVHPRIYGLRLEAAGIKPPGPWMPQGATRPCKGG
jgi:SAM-dependent methyltransferase